LEFNKTTAMAGRCKTSATGVMWSYRVLLHTSLSMAGYKLKVVSNKQTVIFDSRISNLDK
jgi:hypothetical protein